MNEMQGTITIENFGQGNRTRIIGNSLYRICQSETSKKWYIYELYTTEDTFAGVKGCYSENLKTVIDKINGFTSEREIISQVHA